MDGFSLIIGSMLGILAGWAFAAGSVKQREADRKLRRANKADEEVSKKKGEVKSNREGSFADAFQSFLLYALGTCFLFALGVFVFGSVL